jgi:hypothetical protein
MKQLCELYTEIGAFAAEKFPDAGPVEHLLKLRTECGEAINAPGDVIEYADCLIALLGAAHKQGFSLNMLLGATEKKLALNMARKWVRLPDGQYQHAESVHVINSVKHLHELQPGEALVNDMHRYILERSGTRSLGDGIVIFEMHFLTDESPQVPHLITMANTENTPFIVNLHGLWYYKQFIDGLRPRFCPNG